MHTQKNDFSPLMTATVRGEEEAECLPSLCPSSPTGQRAAPRTWARSKVVQSLWMRLAVPGQSCRAACLFRNGWSCHVGFRDTSTDNNNGMQDSHTDPLVVVVFLFFPFSFLGVENKKILTEVQALSPRKHPTAKRIENRTEDEWCLNSQSFFKTKVSGP